MEIKQALDCLVGGQSLTREQMVEVMQQVMTGAVTEAQMGALLVALRIKGEAIDEIVGAAQVMRNLATPVEVSQSYLVDTCGTGGDGSNLFNVSTACAFVVAAAGGKVAKHGNRSVTSTTGSADLLEAAGVNLSLSAPQVARCIDEIGVGFMFAPAHHGAMKYTANVRRQLGMRTIFNVLGPLTNPAGAKRQVMGVFDVKLCRVMAEVLAKLGSEHVMVVHAEDGLDEISLAAPTYVAELKNGLITEYQVTPEMFAIERADLEGLRVTSAQQSLQLIRDALGERDTDAAQKAADIIALNAGAALYVSGVVTTLAEGVALAEDTVATGLAGEKLKQLVEFSRCFA